MMADLADGLFALRAQADRMSALQP